ncbi:uncharacterized protein B0H18DRAFT_1126097 [Fomitopsis serialis]|uniref:uncharacterized protein n=1 Tax=Fomitopsis serialis TaxID=139415 RepID=UPI00200793C9|nr:uncharacterized protein B0H18DRAFT_1126097 [Neoantrodia serialis]KAH9913658.1 hypothetical protein B0H18DRAFT_1126097 [Neoantrodia serialis]
MTPNVDPEKLRQERHDEAVKVLTLLAFNPVGLQRLADTLDRSIIPTSAYHPNLESADIAFMIANAHKDGRHFITHGDVHPAFKEAREQTATGLPGQRVRASFQERVQNLGFDAFTVLDRIDGGCTFAMHVSGTQQPTLRTAGTLPLPQDLRIQVYAPPNVLAEIPSSHATLAKLVQMFTEDLAVHVVQQFEIIARDKLNWSFKWNEDRPSASFAPGPSLTSLLPDSRGTAHYIFSGRPRGQLDTLIGASKAPQSQPTAEHHNLLDEIEVLQRQHEELEVSMHNLNVEIDAKADQIVHLNLQLSIANAKVSKQEALLQKRADEVHVLRQEKAMVQSANERLTKALAKERELIQELKAKLSVDTGMQTMSLGSPS